MTRLWAVLAVVCGASAWGTTLIAASVEQLAAASQAVARVRVVSVEVKRADARHLVTVAECEVLDVLQGSVGRMLKVSTPGGALDGLAQHVAGAPSFTVGEEAVLFLRSPIAQTWQVTGLEQGKWKVEAGQAAPVLSEVIIEGAPRAAAKVALDVLGARVRAVVKEPVR